MDSPNDLEPKKTYDSSVWLWIIPLLLIGIFLLIFLFLSYPRLKHAFKHCFKRCKLFKKKRKNTNAPFPLHPTAATRDNVHENPYIFSNAVLTDDNASIIDIRSLEVQRPASTPLPAYKDLFPSPRGHPMRFSRSACQSPSL